MEEKGFRELRIDPEFKNLIRPLRREEYRQLELNLVMEGCREAIVVWDGTIVDGHNRYEICNKLKIPYGVKNRFFQTGMRQSPGSAPINSVAATFQRRRRSI